jgi:hypothetical protein
MSRTIPPISVNPLGIAPELVGDIVVKAVILRTFLIYYLKGTHNKRDSLKLKSNKIFNIF